MFDYFDQSRDGDREKTDWAPVRQQGEKARIEQEALDGARARDDLAEGDLAGVATKSLSIAVIGQRSRFDHLAVLRARRRILRNSASRSPMAAPASTAPA
jgi:hypothetical protein